MSAPQNMTDGRQRRREEAELLICRLMSDLTLLRSDIDGIRAASLDQELMRRDPSYVSDNLHGCPSPLMRYDLSRLLDLVREGV